MTEADGKLRATPVVTALKLYPNPASRPLPQESCFDTAGTHSRWAGATSSRKVRNPLPRGWRRGGRRGSCSSSAARAETLSDSQEDLRDHRRKPPLSLRKKPPQLRTIPPSPRKTIRNSKKPSSPTEENLRYPKKSQKTMKIWLKEQKMFFWPYHRGGGGIFIFL